MFLCDVNKYPYIYIATYHYLIYVLHMRCLFCPDLRGLGTGVAVLIEGNHIALADHATHEVPSEKMQERIAILRRMLHLKS